VTALAMAMGWHRSPSGVTMTGSRSTRTEISKDAEPRR
jgi:hypothetical protein